MKRSRNLGWGTHLGNNVTIRGISDEHLANTIQFVRFYKTHPLREFLPSLKKEARLRKLSNDFLARAPFPYKDGKGNWIIWDYQNNEPKEIGRYDRSPR